MRAETLVYENEIENAICRLSSMLKSDYGVSKRTVASLLLQQDEEIIDLVKEREKDNFKLVDDSIRLMTGRMQMSPMYAISYSLQKQSMKILAEVFKCDASRGNKFKTFLNRVTVSPVTGTLILLAVLYLGFYKFVGILGAGTLVNFIEKTVFENYINPFVNSFINGLIPWKNFSDLFVNDYGIITLGIKYATAIVLPIVGCFFLMFSIIEDSGYLPRISLLMDRIFKKIGLNGRAVIPMVLGFGCDTMATMVSRTLETKRERVITTLLLALAIPCSAQLGVILALLSSEPAALAVWVVFMVLVFLFVGFLGAKVIPGERPGFYMEIPPLRLPRLSNVLKKTYTRLYWYFKEVLPLFILASVLIWAGNLTGVFSMLINMLKPVVNLLGLPDSTAAVFLLGFFRRDYGAAGLFDLQGSGLMNGRQLAVTAVTLTLFVPCVAQFVMMLKERGAKTAMGIAAFILPFSFACGFLLNKLLIMLGLGLG